MNLCFFQFFFLSPKIDPFFSRNRQQSNTRAGQVMRGLNLMRALI